MARRRSLTVMCPASRGGAWPLAVMASADRRLISCRDLKSHETLQV